MTCSIQRNERLISLGHGAPPPRHPRQGYGMSRGDREWTVGGLYAKGNEKTVNHFQQRSEQTCI